MSGRIRRVFWIVLDSFGVGELPDASRYGDEGSNTLRTVTGKAGASDSQSDPPRTV